MINEPMESGPEPVTVTPPGLWTDRPRIWIVGLIFMLMAGNVFFQIQAYLLGGGLILPVLAGQVFGVFIPLIVISRRNRWNPIVDLDLHQVPWLVPVIAAILAVATLVPSSLLAEISMRIFPGDPERIAMFQEGLPRSLTGIILTITTVVLVGPLGEEIVFRGLLHRLASGYWSPAKATLLASLVFALVHAEPWLLLGLVGIGVALSFLYEVTGSLFACWVFHAVHNAVALLMMYNTDEVQTEPSPLTIEDILWLGASLVVWAIIGSWLWKRRNPHQDS
jgi:membrane protease YdiL (CAAX protease family)